MNSPFQQHLGGNYVPSVDEIRDIKIILDASAKEVRDIDAQIDQLQQKLQLLQEQRYKVHSVLEQHQALISPARRISRDVLEEIFLACLPDDQNPCMSATEAPMLLTRVCGSWRNIAHSTPRLWSAIHITIPIIENTFHPPESSISLREGLVQRKLEQRQAAAKEWLDRSGQCPLSISVYESPDHGVSMLHLEKIGRLHISFFINALVPYCHRWYYVDFCVSAHLLDGLVRKNGLNAENMKMLKKLHITSDREWHIVVRWTDIVSLLSPKLTSATFSGFAVRSSDLSLIPKQVWEQLTELNLEPIDYASTQILNPAIFVSSVIFHCRALKKLKVKLVSTSSPVTDTGALSQHGVLGNIVLSQLAELSLSVSSTMEVVDFVKSLKLPALKQLELQIYPSGSDNPDEMFGPILSTLLRDCGVDKLQSLGLYATPFATVEMVQFLRLLPDLKCLKISSSHLVFSRWTTPSFDFPYFAKYLVNDELLHALSPFEKDYSDIICPQLEVLEVDREIVTGVSEYVLKEFMKARKSAHLLDDRIANLRRLRMPINEFKRKGNPHEEKVVLGENSAVYFRHQDNFEGGFSPSEGLDIGREQDDEVPSYLEVYTEL